MCISAMCLLLVVSFLGSSARGNQAQAAFDEAQLRDPVGALLLAYIEASDRFRELENPSPAARLALWQEWRDRFQKIIAEHPLNEAEFPRDMFIRSAKRQLVALHNGLGEYDKSQVLLQEMIAETRNPEEKVELYNQLGTISRARHLTSRRQGDLEKAQEAFEQANELFLSLPPEEREGRIAGEQIVNLCTAATAAREAGDHERAATLFRSARELFQESTENARYAVSMGYDLEIITEQEMMQWIRVREEANALHCLRILSELSSPRWVPSWYALQYATLWYANDSTGFQRFVSKWLEDNAFDGRTPILMARLGFSSFDDELYEKALPIYETLRDNHRADFQRLEPRAFEGGSGGHYGRVLADLARIYAQLDDRGKVESVRTEMVSLFPECPRVQFLTRQGSSWDGSEYVVPRRQNLFFRLALTGIGVALIVLGLYLWRKGV